MTVIQDYLCALNGIGVLDKCEIDVTGEASFLSVCLEKVRSRLPVVFDVGAHVGDYTREVLKRSPRARVFVFEPHPKTFASLGELAELPNVTPLNLALGERDGELPFYDYRDMDGSFHASLYREVIETLHHAPSVTHTVAVRRLADVAAEYGVDRIDLLKVDTEGHEYAVLEGAEPLIRAGAVDVIHFEFNEMNVISRRFFKDFWDFLPEYDFYRLLPDGVLHIGKYIPLACEIFGFQNIVCVRKDHKLY